MTNMQIKLYNNRENVKTTFFFFFLRQNRLRLMAYLVEPVQYFSVTERSRHVNSRVKKDEGRQSRDELNSEINRLRERC